jgi:6,7-dimethyl-8-ribityllumazine synthase
MATAYQNLSDYDASAVPDASAMKFGIVVSEWNPTITNALLQGAYSTLIKHGAEEENIIVSHVPGSFELVFGAKTMAEETDVSAVIVLGCVVQGETPHFQFVCQGVTQGISDLNRTEDIPFIFGLLTTDTMQQALDRAGGKHGNKGDEAAVTAIKMAHFSRQFELQY